MWCYLDTMKRATITIPDDLEEELNAFLKTQDAPPSLTSVLQAALRRYLEERKLSALEYRPPVGPLRIEPAAQGSGGDDGSVDHDRHLADRS